MPCKRGAANFDPKETEAYQALQKKFGEDVTLDTLAKCAVKLHEEEEDIKKPSAAVLKSLEKLYKWYHDNWENIESVLDSINLEDNDEEEDEEEEGEEAEEGEEKPAEEKPAEEEKAE